MTETADQTELLDHTESTEQTEVPTQDLALPRTAWALQDPLLTEYYDTEWGRLITSERGLYERIVLESFQAGLSWLTVLKKREALREAFANFDPEAVAGFTEQDVERLLADARIIRNRAKIEAAITNAQATLALRESGGLAALVWSHTPARSCVPVTEEEIPSQTEESRELARALRGQGFRFVGSTTAFALMCAVGMVDAHVTSSHMRGVCGLRDAAGQLTEEGRRFVDEVTAPTSAL